MPRQLKILPHQGVAPIRNKVDAALAAGDFMSLEPLLSPNLDQDEELSRRAAVFCGLETIHGKLTPEPDSISAFKPTKCTWYLKGEKGRVGVTLMINPESPPKIQTLQITSVLQPTSALEEALAAAVTTFEAGVEISPLVLPVQRVHWVSCDGEKKGAALIEGARGIDARVSIDLGKEGVPLFSPVPRHETLPA